jgi:hypothetical protein
MESFTASVVADSQFGASNADHHLQSHHAALHAYEELHGLWVKSANNRRPTTEDDYWKALKSFADATERKALADITRKDVVQFRDALLQQGLSATTATHKVGILKTLFNVGISYELLVSNPAANVRTQKVSGGKSRVAFSADDLQRIFSSASRASSCFRFSNRIRVASSVAISATSSASTCVSVFASPTHARCFTRFVTLSRTFAGKSALKKRCMMR